MKTLITLSLLLSYSAFSLNHSIKTTFFSPLNIKKIHSEDVKNEKLGNAPRFAIPHSTKIDLLNTTMVEQDGFLLFKHRIVAPNAVSLNFAFDFKMSQNSSLSLYASDFSDAINNFDSKFNNPVNELWSPVIFSDDVIVELKVPKSELNQIIFNIKQVNQGYRTFTQTTEKAGSCNVDVVCSQSRGWENEINSVGVISTGGSTFCTGFMVNNTANDKKPLFMTAKHCRISASNAQSLVVYWNYQASKCGGRRDGRKRQFNTGSKYLAGSSKSDFTIVELFRDPNPSWNVTYAGWDRSGLDARSATAIHHPATDEKSISFENDPTTVTSYLGEAIPGDGTHVRVEDWDMGTTEPGSSGSPLFNDEHRVIGQLHGGYASCSSQTSDWYGRIHTSWTGDGTANSRLSDWLDPGNTGAMTTDTIQ